MTAIRKIINQDDRLFTPQEAAEYLGLSIQTLAGYRCKKSRNIPYIKMGKVIRYKKSDLDDHLESCTIRS